MRKFEFYNPTKLIFGQGTLQSLRTEVPKYGKNVLLMYGGGSIKRSGLYDNVIAELAAVGAVVTELAGVEPNPRLSTVHKGVALCHEHHIDLILPSAAAACWIVPRQWLSGQNMKGICGTL